MNLLDKIEKFIAMIPFHGCHEWIGGKGSDGYALVKVDGKTRRVSRLIIELKLGRSLKNKEHALHRCDNRSCVNPDHLFVGTNYDNVLDKCKKGRLGGSPGNNKKKTHCINGHEFTDENTRVRKRKLGGRVCKVCDRENQRRYYGTRA